ncbi:MAG: dienelactone hydrolase family protein [Planctomycetes bacterium]|nr:dienelactone hydrolase family protein [Planctomycetota bacterium]
MTVKGSFVDLQTPTGLMRTYVYLPENPREAGQKSPGLLLYSEIFQQTPPIRRLAMQFASHGFLVMVPEIYHEHLASGTVLGYDDAGKDRGNALKHQTRLSTFDRDAQVVLTALEQHAACTGRLGVVGFCIGGHLAFRAAFHEEVRAACCFYPTDIHSGTLGEGKKSDSLQRVREIRGELMMIWGRQDPHIPDEGRLAIYRSLREAGVFFTWHEFNAAHAFMRDEGERYDPSAARSALALALDLFHRAL